MEASLKKNIEVLNRKQRNPPCLRGSLKNIHTIQQEFRRQTGRDAQEGLTAFLERSTKALYELFRMKSSSKQKAKQILEAAENCPEEGETLLANGALILLPCLLKERSNNLIQQEFRRQTGRDAQEGLTAFLERSTKALYELFRMKSSSKQKAKQILEAAENCPEEGKTLLANGALILLPCLLKERSNNLVKSLV
ncbi:uncharacterized protein ISCGN_023106 [Ixodes scapularis]